MRHEARRLCLVACAQTLTPPPLPVQFVPFIQGPRNCLGQFFALLEGRVVLALLVKVRLSDSKSYRL